MPLAIRVPPRFRGSGGVPQTLGSTVGNVDLAPTILDLAGAQPCPPAGACRVLDGRSLLPAIQTGGRDWPQQRALPLELDGSDSEVVPNTPCAYQGLRTSSQVYVQYREVVPPGPGHGVCEPDNEVEHYDLSTDPSELNNRYPAPPGTAEAGLQQSLSAEAAELSDCAGSRDAIPAAIGPLLPVKVRPLRRTPAMPRVRCA